MFDGGLQERVRPQFLKTTEAELASCLSQI